MTTIQTATQKSHSSDSLSLSNSLKNYGRQWTHCLVLATIALASCSDQKPKGQVVATVNGAEITAQELQAEYRATGINNGPQLLRNVIDRKLLSATTKDAPTDPVDLIRTHEALRAQREVNEMTKTVPLPADVDARKFIADHATQFKDRQLVQVNQLMVAAPQLAGQLKTAETMDDVEHTLKGLDAHFVTEHRMMDTLEMAPQMAQVMTTSKIGNVNLVVGDKQIIAFAVDSRVPIQLTDTQQLNLAKNIMRSQAAKKKVAEAVAKMEKAAKIEYKETAAKKDAAGKSPAAPAPGAAPANAAK